MDKPLENDQGPASYAQQNLSIYYTHIRHRNFKIVEVRKAIKKTLRQNRSFLGESAAYITKQLLTNKKKTKQKYFIIIVHSVLSFLDLL